MTDKEALKLALEALDADELDMVDDGSGNMIFRKEQAITAIKEALAQPEQEPVAWMHIQGNYQELLFRQLDDWEIRNGFKQYPLYTAPPQRKPLTDEQRKDLMNKAWDKWLGGEDDNHLFAWHFSFEVEAAHDIKETT